MNSHRSAIALGNAAVFFACVARVCLFAQMTSAQQILAPPPPDFSGLSPALRMAGTNELGYVPPPPAGPAQDQPVLQWGPAQFRPHFLYRFLYGDGIPAAPGQGIETAIHEIYPGILIGLGSQWRLDYTPVLRFYSDQHFRNTFDNSVELTGGSTFRDWTLGFSQSYVSSSEPLIETGTQTDRETHSTALSAIYQMSTAMSLELGLNQNFRFVGQNNAGEQLTDSDTWSTADWLNYQFSPRIAAAIGIGAGYDRLSAGSDMTFEQLQARFTWRPGEKLFLSVSAGCEDRQFLNSSASDAWNPIFGVSAQYRLFEQTTLSLGASRTVGPSYLVANRLMEATVISASVRQRLLSKLFLDVSGGYTRTTYKASSSAFSDRNDDATFFNARLSLPVLRRGTIAVFYQRIDDSSNQSNFNVSSSQGGFEVGYRF